MRKFVRVRVSVGNLEAGYFVVELMNSSARPRDALRKDVLGRSTRWTIGRDGRSQVARTRTPGELPLFCRNPSTVQVSGCFKTGQVLFIGTVARFDACVCADHVLVFTAASAPAESPRAGDAATIPLKSVHTSLFFGTYIHTYIQTDRQLNKYK